jgi:hypothetical protein
LFYLQPEDPEDIDGTCVRPICLPYNCVVDVSFFVCFLVWSLKYFLSCFIGNIQLYIYKLSCILYFSIVLCNLILSYNMILNTRDKYVCVTVNCYNIQTT